MHAVAQAIAIVNEFAIDKNHHMLPDSTLLVEDIPTRLPVFAEVCVQDGPQGRTRNLASRTLDVPLDVSRESYRRHSVR